MKKQYVAPVLYFEIVSIPDSMISSSNGPCIGTDNVTEAYWPDDKPKYNYIYPVEGGYKICVGV